MIAAWRIVKTRYAASAFTGEGARLYGGRWTSKGRRAIYTSESHSLATLEMLVHLGDNDPLLSYSVISVGIPDGLVADIDYAALPPGWRGYPADAALQALGDAWLDARKQPALRVPSAIIPSEYNYLLNPGHGGFRKLKIGAPQRFDFDPRLRQG